MAKRTLVFSKTYTNGVFISVIISGYGSNNAPFEVLIEKDNETYQLNNASNLLLPTASVNGWLTFGNVQEIINHLDKLEKEG